MINCIHEQDQSVLVLNGDAFTVCIECGMVVDEHYYADLPYMPVHCFSPRYQRIFHSNERLAQFTQTGPPLREDAYELLEVEYLAGFFAGIYPPTLHLTAGIIHEICASITLTEEQREVFRSTKYKRNRPTSLKQYGERWVEIKSRFVGRKIVEPDPNCVIQLKRYFALLQIPFDTVIKGVYRENFPNYNVTYCVGLELTGYPHYKKYFPLIKGIKQLRRLCSILWLMFQFLKWPPTPTLLRYATNIEKSLAVGVLWFPEREKASTRAPSPPLGLPSALHYSE